MPNNHGKIVEDEMMLALNNHRIMDLIPNLHYLMEELFGALEPNETVLCTQPNVPIKPDLIITYKGVTKGLSIKSGTSEYMHGEPVERFVEYLREQEVSEETLKTILLNQFGDGTINGTGKERMELAELKYRLSTHIKKANDELNNNYELLVNLMDRMLFKGWDKNAIPAYAIYHGDLYSGTIVTRTQVMKYIRDKDWNYYDNFHIGPIFLRPHARYIGKEIKSVFSQHKIDGFWPNLLADMNYISKKYFSYTPINKRTRSEDW